MVGQLAGAGSSYYYMYMLPSWWRKLFLSDEGLERFVGAGIGRVNILYVDDGTMPYPELIRKLDSLGYKYFA